MGSSLGSRGFHARLTFALRAFPPFAWSLKLKFGINCQRLIRSTRANMYPLLVNYPTAAYLMFEIKKRR